MTATTEATVAPSASTTVSTIVPTAVPTAVPTTGLPTDVTVTTPIPGGRSYPRVCRHCVAAVHCLPDAEQLTESERPVQVWVSRAEGWSDAWCPALVGDCPACDPAAPDRGCAVCDGEGLLDGGVHDPLSDVDAIAALPRAERRAIGPRRAGGVYAGGVFQTDTYRVLAVLTGAAARLHVAWSDYALVEQDLGGMTRGRVRIHTTPWARNRHARVLALPLDADPYLADIERAARVCEQRGDVESGGLWRETAARYLSGQGGDGNWAAAQRLLTRQAVAA